MPLFCQNFVTHFWHPLWRDYLPNNVFHLLYADDLQVYFQVPSEDVIATIEKLSQNLRMVSD